MSTICGTCGRPLDLQVVCVSCGAGFTVTLDEQKWLAGRGLANPKRCGRCRKEAREARERNRGANAPEER